MSAPADQAAPLGPAASSFSRRPLEPLRRMGRYYRRTLYGGAVLLTCLIVAATVIAGHARMQSFVESQQYLFAAEKNLVESQIGKAEVRARQMVARYDGAWAMQSAMPVPAQHYLDRLREEGGSVVTDTDLSAVPQHLVTTLTQRRDLPRLTRLLTLVRDLAPGSLVEMKLTGHVQQSFVYGGRRQFLATDPPFDLPAVLEKSGVADIGKLIASQTAVVDAALRAHGQAAGQSSQVVWVGPHDDLIFDQRVLSYATRLFRHDQLFAVFVNNVPLAELESRFLRRPLKPGFVLLAAGGEQIAGPRLDAQRAQAVRTALARAPSGGLGGAAPAPDRAQVASSAGIFVLTQPIAETGWILAYLFDDNVIVAGLHGEIALMLLLTLGICAALWLGVFLFDKYVFSRVHRDAERALESEHFKRIMLATAPVGLCVLDYHSGHAMLDNELAAQYTDTARADGRGDTFHERLWAAYRQPPPESEPGEAAGPTLCREVAITHPCGRQVHLLVAFAKGRHEGRDVLLCGLSDISSRKQAEQLLVAAKRSADQANAAKSQFLASMSHEIRTPLHGALGHLELLGLAPMAPAQRDLVATIQQSFTALLRIINDVLDISKIEAERLTLEHARFDPAELVESTVRTIAPLIGKKGVQLFCLIDSAVPAGVMGDALRVRQILNNVLGNAAKFTEAGKITVRLALLAPQAERHWLRLQVIDSGIGIARDEQEKLFARFTQANESITRSYGGTGLGLALCKLLCDLMGGRISLASEPGVGSAFTVDLPFDPAPAPTPANTPRTLLTAEARWDDPLPTPAEPSVEIPADLPAKIAPPPVVIVCAAAEWRADLVAQFGAWGAPASAFESIDALAACATPETAVLVLALSAPERQAAAATAAREIGGSTAAARFARRVVISPHGPLSPQAEQGWITVSSLARQAWRDAWQGISGSGAEPRPARRPMAPRGQRILIVEDDAVSRQLLMRQLATLGYTHVDTAQNGREGLEKCLAQVYELVLSDLSMPGLDGYQLVQALRDHSLNVPVIIVAASEWQSDRLAARVSGPGIAGFLGKPASIEPLQAMLDRVFAEAPAQGALPAAAGAPAALSGAASAPEPAAAQVEPPDMELYGLFVDTLESDLEVLRAALRHDDRPAFLRGAHKLKGALAILGEAALADACGELSAQAGRQPLSQLRQALAHFETALAQAMRRAGLPS